MASKYKEGSTLQGSPMQQQEHTQSTYSRHHHHLRDK